MIHDARGSRRGRDRARFGLLPCAALPLALAGCEGVQSALTPDGPAAREIALLWWVMLVGGSLIFALVLALTAWTLIARPDRRRLVGPRALIVSGGVVLPVIVLSALLVYGIQVGRAITATGGDPLEIEVVGEMWWWEVRYPTENGGEALVTANEIRIPVGRPVEIALTTRDVIHSFWVPRLAGKIDMIPGRTNRLRLQADRPGEFRGQCAEYCGAQHARMAFYVVAEPAERFETWLERQREPAREPTIPFLERGRDVFLAGGCGACHTVRGIGAEGDLGPDLTHVGSRLTLAAGILDNNVGNLAAWIVDSQRLKPGNRMPSFREFDGESLRALAAYLASLE